MIRRFLMRLNAARSLSWPVVAARGLRRMGVDNAWLDRVDFLNSPDAARPTKAPDIPFAAMRTAGLEPDRLLAGVAGATVLEIGCGRYIGFAAVSSVLGARLYIGADPGLKPDLYRNRAVLDRVVTPSIEAAAALTGGSTLPADAMLSRCRLEKCGVLDALRADETIDLCVSVSCLEHIGDFTESIHRIAVASGPQTRHVHLVNFSNHLSKDAPFAHLYEARPEAFARDWGAIVNGLRYTDMAEIFRSAGLPLRFVPLDRVEPDRMPDRIDPYWTTRYDAEVLSVRTGLFYSEALERVRD